MQAVFACTVLACAILSPDSAEAQRARFSDPFGFQGSTPVPPANLPGIPGLQGGVGVPGNLGIPGNLTIPGNVLPGSGSIITTPPAANLQLPNFGPGGIGQGIPGTVLQPPPGAIIQGVPNFGGGLPSVTAPSFDPSRAPNQTFPIFPRVQQNQPSIFQAPFPQTNPQGQIFQPPAVQPQFQQPQFQQPQFQQPNFNGGFGPGYGPGFGQVQGGFGPNRWPYAGTGTNWLPSIDWSWPQQAWRTFRTQFLPRVLERPRIRQTYLQGNNGNELNINDIEIATTATLPNFLQGTQPLRISPGFIFHWWDGPDSNVFPDFDLPARAYSAYLSFDHVTDPSRISGLENNLTVGYYSDFDNTSSDAVRITGRFLGWYRLNEYTVGKLGVEYFDRVNVKLLPAVGLYMTPNPDLKLDLFFPRTKLSHRIPNFADFEAWAYLGAEYGGGSWAIERRDGARDQVDINDVRAFVGLEWIGPRRVTGFFEFGYAFEREIVYRSNALNSLELQDTLMVRSGIAF